MPKNPEIKLEKYYQDKILKYLRSRPNSFTWKQAAAQYSRAGIPDIAHIENGRYFGFEVKRPKIGKATAIQLATIEKIRAAGGVAEIVSSPEEVEEVLRRELL